MGTLEYIGIVFRISGSVSCPASRAATFSIGDTFSLTAVAGGKDLLASTSRRFVFQTRRLGPLLSRTRVRDTQSTFQTRRLTKSGLKGKYEAGQILLNLIGF